MASQSENASSFDFGPEVIFDPDLVANKVIWPLVNKLWGGDWLKESQAGDDFWYPRHGVHSDRSLDIEIEVDCDKWVDEEGKKELYSATLFIEEKLTGLGKNIGLAAARLALEETLENVSNDEDVEDEYDEAEAEEVIGSWPEGEDDELTVKTGTTYSFATDCDFTVEYYRNIKGIDGGKFKIAYSAEDDRPLGDNLRLHDIEELSAACHILRAPEAIHEALKEIKNQPISGPSYKDYNK